MKSLHFEDTDDDSCVYYNQSRSIIIVLDVDDGLMIGKDVIKMNKILDEKNVKFGITRQLISWNANKVNLTRYIYKSV